MTNRLILKLSAILIALCSPIILQAQESTPVGAKNDIKVTLLSLGSGSSRFTYERAIDPKHSAEITIGIVGMGWDWINHSDPKGYIVKLAPKWNIHPVGRSNSPLSGFYLKPELIYANYAYSYGYKERYAEEAYVRETTSQLALLAEGGFQIVADWFVFDIYVGVGPSFGTGNRNNYYHGFMNFPADGHVAFTSGFRIGVAF